MYVCRINGDRKIHVNFCAVEIVSSLVRIYGPRARLVDAQQRCMYGEGKGEKGGFS
jgi:hypothetical protein